jgi:hypothetical protein
MNRLPSHEPNPEFDAIVSGLRAEMRDPIISDIMKHVSDLEASLNTNGGRLTDNERKTAEFAINSVLDGAGLGDTDIVVSGKLRFDHVDYPEMDDATIERWTALFGKLNEDEDGLYFQLDHRTMTCGVFDVVTRTTDEGRPLHRVALGMSDPSEEDEIDVYVYLDELDDFTPKDPSLARMLREIREHYPDIAAALDTLPEDCGDDQAIINALGDFILEIDWSRHPGLDKDEQVELIEYIEHYIAHRLQFDTSEYEFEICGPFHKKTYSGKSFRQSAELPTIKRGRVLGIELKRQNPAIDDGTISSYVPELQIWATVARRGGGNEYITLPLYSLNTITNLRNAFDGFEDDGAEYTPDAIDYDTIEWPVEKAQQKDGQSVGENSPQTIHETVVEREKKLAELNERLQRLVDACLAVGQERLKNEDEVIATRDDLFEVMKAFLDIHAEITTSIEVSGPGVISLPTTTEIDFNDETDEFTIKISGTEAVEPDLLTFKKGYITGMNTAHVLNDDESHGIMTFLRCRDLESVEPLVIGHDAVEGFPFFEGRFAKGFAANLSVAGTTVSLPEYERILSVKRQIEQIKKRFSDVEEVPKLLESLYEFMAVADPSDFNDFPDVGLINKLGEVVGGDEELVDKVSTAVVDIMAEAPVDVAGVAYTETGELLPYAKLRGKVLDIVPEVSFIPESEPMIKIYDIEDGIHYVPFSTIESLRI